MKTRVLDEPAGQVARAPAKSPQVRLPKSVGAYEVVGALGRGGMGEVYKAEHALLGRFVALKRLVVPEDADEPTRAAWTERFLREGRALARLQQDNIVAVHDLFEHRRELYLALELVDGFALTDLLRGGPVPVDVGCIIGIQVLRALETAHRNGIIHRDVKPANVMVSRSGVVKLMDFGIARDGELDTITATGSVVGTPSYLAPELVKGGKPDTRSDVYAVGALLYELLSGVRLFGHANADNIWGLVALGKFKRLGKVAPHLPWRLTLAVERCLKQDPKRRPANAAELRGVLERFLDDVAAPADHATRLVGWLVAAGHVSEPEALLVVDTAAFEALDVVPLKGRRQPWRIAALASGAVAVALTAALVFGGDAALESLAAFARTARAWLPVSGAER